jgi:hypothetical protein
LHPSVGLVSAPKGNERDSTASDNNGAHKQTTSHAIKHVCMSTCVNANQMHAYVSFILGLWSKSQSAVSLAARTSPIPKLIKQPVSRHGFGSLDVRIRKLYTRRSNDDKSPPSTRILTPIDRTFLHYHSILLAEGRTREFCLLSFHCCSSVIRLFSNVTSPADRILETCPTRFRPAVLVHRRKFHWRKCNLAPPNAHEHLNGKYYPSIDKRLKTIAITTAPLLPIRPGDRLDVGCHAVRSARE